MPGARRSWREVRDRIHSAILSGEYAPGDKLPRDADLAAEFNCARTTVQRAMRDLSDSGLLARRRRGGTSVRPDPVARATLEIPVTRHEIEAEGARYGYRLIRRSLGPAPGAVRTAMGVAAPRRMLRVEALHLAEDRPHLLEDRWICPVTVPEILSVDLARVSANEWLVRNRPLSRCDLSLSAEAAPPRVAELLTAAPGAPLLVTERTTWIGPEPITHLRAFARPGYRLTARI